MTCLHALLSVATATLFLCVVAVRGEAAVTNPPSSEPTHAADPEAKDWAFDQGLYTNNPKTGERVRQYQKGSRAYRDPNSFFDSSHDDYPFMPSPFYSPYYLPYIHYVPYPYGEMPYGPAYGSYRYAP